MNETPETKPEPRDLPTINAEYTRCATLLGDKAFKLRVLSAEVDLLMVKMQQLNTEAGNLTSPTDVPPPKAA